MGIKRATLYYQPKKNINKKQKELRIRKKIEDISREHPYYGYRRITASLRRDQVIVNHKKVLKIMKELGIQGRIKHKYVTTTNSKHNNKITSKKNKGGARLMGIKKRKYSQEFKEEIVQRALSGERILALGKEHNLSPGLINRWKRQYLDGELSGNNNQEIKKLETQVAKLEQMIGKLTMENYILKKEKEYLLQRKKEDSSIITGPYLNRSKKAAD